MPASPPASPLRGIGLYSAGVLFFVVNDALGKWLVADYSVAEVMALRGLGALLVLGPVLWFARRHLASPAQIGIQLARIAMSAADTYCFYFSSRSLPLADVMTFYLAAPLIVVALSSLMLGERVGLNRWLAVGLGFVGVVIALRPTGAAVAPGALVATAGSFCFAFTILVTRWLRGTHWLQLVAYQVVGSGLIGAVGAPFGWAVPGAGDLGLMMLVGIVSMSCFMLVTKALALAPASLVAPFQYLSIVWAALIGWLVWGDVPTGPVLLGSVVIVVSGLLVLRRAPRAQPV